MHSLLRVLFISTYKHSVDYDHEDHPEDDDEHVNDNDNEQGHNDDQRSFFWVSQVPAELDSS